MSRGATARLFVAVELPLSVCEELGAWARRVASTVRTSGSSRGTLRLLDARSLHLTLCFLGSRPVGEIDTLASSLAPGAGAACELSIGAPLWLPSRRPQALAVEIHDRSGELARAQQRVSEALAGVSTWLPERRRFRPHVTVARVRRGARRGRRSGAGALDTGAKPSGGEQQLLPPTPRLSFAPQSIALYRSWLGPEGASYEELASARCFAA